MDRPTRLRLHILFAVIGLVVLAILIRASRIQITEHTMWASRAASQILRELDLPARRGTIMDRNGVPIAVSGVRYEIGIAPNEIRDTQRDELADSLASVLRLSKKDATTMVSTRDPWRVVPGRFTAEERARLKGFRGLHFTPLIRREHPQGLTAQPVVGQITADGRALGGVEAKLDSLLSGIPGRRTVYRDVRGRTRQAAGPADREPVPGGDVVLAIDADLQLVASEILLSQIREVEADAGDVVILSPQTGDVLALVGRTAEGAHTLSPLTAPYEPGSIMKPFAYATLLQAGAITLQDSVFAEWGSAVINGRTITDVGKHGWIRYLNALAVSSNIAIVKTIGRVPDTLQYEYLKGLGFGQTSGMGVGSESPGLLRDRTRWSKFSQGSLAIGYEISATPLQMAVAYGTLANKGVRMHPRLILETRNRDGEVTVNEPREAQRVVTEEVAEEMLRALEFVVKEGSGGRADLGTFTVAGKSGTSRAWGSGGYNGYYASFASLFPAKDPQLAIIVRLVRPKGSAYYGGVVAAPVVRKILEAMLSSDHPPISRNALASGSALPASIEAAPLTPAPVRWRDLSPSVTLPRPE